jgi:hypothetical protein
VVNTTFSSEALHPWGRVGWGHAQTRRGPPRPSVPPTPTLPLRGGGRSHVTEKSSAKIVPWAYQPCTNTVTLVVLAPVVNWTLSWV